MSYDGDFGDWSDEKDEPPVVNFKDMHFRKVSFEDKELIFSWLDERHVKEFWDNSPEHREDIEIFMGGRKLPSSYFDGIFSYWVGSIKDDPYCLVMTHEEFDEPNTPECFRPYLFEAGRTFGLDFCIGNRSYLGKGLAALALEAFMAYFAEIETDTKVFLIDPNLDNPRAIHVYKKARFEIISKFTQEGGYFNQSKHVLMVRTV